MVIIGGCGLFLILFGEGYWEFAFSSIWHAVICMTSLACVGFYIWVKRHKIFS
jgi:hypothetical protein